MKTSDHTPKIEICLCSFALSTAILIFASGSALAQVTIPSQSASSLTEERPEAPQIVLPSSPSSIITNPGVSRVPPQAPSRPVESTPATAGARLGMPVTAIQRVPPVTQNIDNVKIQRLAELRRELRIADAATVARITLHADSLFQNDSPEKIDDLITPTLRSVIEFIELNDKKDITVRSFYAQDQENSKNLAWARSLALIEWMTNNSSLDLETFKATGPSPVLRASPKPFATKVGDMEFVNRIELILE